MAEPSRPAGAVSPRAGSHARPRRAPRRAGARRNPPLLEVNPSFCASPSARPIRTRHCHWAAYISSRRVTSRLRNVGGESHRPASCAANAEVSGKFRVGHRLLIGRELDDLHIGVRLVAVHGLGTSSRRPLTGGLCQPLVQGSVELVDPARVELDDLDELHRGPPSGYGWRVECRHGRRHHVPRSTPMITGVANRSSLVWRSVGRAGVRGRLGSGSQAGSQPTEPCGWHTRARISATAGHSCEILRRWAVAACTS